MGQDLVFFSGFMFTSMNTVSTSILSGTLSKGFSTWVSQDAHAGLTDGFHVKMLTHTEMHCTSSLQWTPHFGTTVCLQACVCASHTGEWGRGDTIKAPPPPGGHHRFLMRAHVCMCVWMRLCICSLRPLLRQRCQFLRRQEAPPIYPGPAHFLCASIKDGLLSLRHSLTVGTPQELSSASSDSSSPGPHQLLQVRWREKKKKIVEFVFNNDNLKYLLLWVKTIIVAL